jgi:hypothetical protein
MTQFRGRAGCTTTNSLQLLNSFIKDTWRKKHEAIGLFLDMKGAFPNAVIPCLVHDMNDEARGCSQEGHGLDNKTARGEGNGYHL